MDIDILLWGNTEIKSNILQIPHPGLFDRDFVLIPLMDLMKSFFIGTKHFLVKELIDKTSVSCVTRVIAPLKQC